MKNRLCQKVLLVVVSLVAQDYALQTVIMLALAVLVVPVVGDVVEHVRGVLAVGMIVVGADFGKKEKKK